MNTNEIEVADFMESIRAKYFPELAGVSFEVKRDTSFEGVMGRALFGRTPKVILHYSDDRILKPAYRIGLIAVVSHELAHYVDPVDPERVMRDKLPAPMMVIWEELLKAGYAKCSMAGTR